MPRPRPRRPRRATRSARRSRPGACRSPTSRRRRRARPTSTSGATAATPRPGRVKAPSVYAVPCVPVFTDGDNGGATTSGVTADSIKIVRYVAEQSADLQSLIAGIDATDTPEELDADVPAVLDALDRARGDYGRKVEYRRLPGHRRRRRRRRRQGRRDADRRRSCKPFAVVGGPGLDRGTFARGDDRPTASCASTAPAPSRQDMADAMEPLVWSRRPAPTSSSRRSTRGSANFDEDARRRRERGVRRRPTRCATSPRKIGVDPLRLRSAVVRAAERRRARHRLRHPSRTCSTSRRCRRRPPSSWRSTSPRTSRRSSSSATRSCRSYLQGGRDRAGVLPRVDLHRDRAHRHEHPRPRLRPAADDAGVRHLAARRRRSARTSRTRSRRTAGTSAPTALPPAKNQYSVIAPVASNFLVGGHPDGRARPDPEDVRARPVPHPARGRRPDRAAGELRQLGLLHGHRLLRHRRLRRDLVGPDRRSGRRDRHDGRRRVAPLRHGRALRQRRRRADPGSVRASRRHRHRGHDADRPKTSPPTTRRRRAHPGAG